MNKDFGTLYHPQSALVFYRTEGKKTDTYVEFFDMDTEGTPVNAHPLTMTEASRLAETLKNATSEQQAYLHTRGIISSQTLHFDPQKGTAVWFTKAGKRQLYFTESLGIPDGTANVPAMLWAAGKTSLSVFALGSNRRPTEKTKLYNAPFFNIYAQGNVCMGTVDVQIKKAASLNEFTTAWENYFFNSRFSHLLEEHNPVNGNCVSLWTNLINTDQPFPTEVLTQSSVTIKKLIS